MRIGMRNEKAIDVYECALVVIWNFRGAYLLGGNNQNE